MIRKFLTSVFLVYLCFGFPFAGLSQEPSYRHYYSANGLPSSQVYDVIQDDWGYLWFTTDRGLSRYDGYSFKNYSTKDGLPNNVVFEFYMDPKGRGIWCTSLNNELFRIVGKDPEFIPFEYNHLITIDKRMTISDFYIDSDDNYYMRFLNSVHFTKISKDGRILEKSTSFFNRELTDNYILALIPESNGKFSCELQTTKPAYNDKFKVLVSNNEHVKAGLLSSTGKVEALYFEEEDKIIFGGSNMILAIKDGKPDILFKSEADIIHLGKLTDSTFWFSTDSKGLFEINLDGDILNSYLPNKFTVRMYIDHENNRWITTLYQGVFKFRSDAIKTIKAGERHKFVSSITHDDKHQIWVGYQNGDIYKIKSGKPQIVIQSQKAWPASVTYDSKEKQIYLESDFRLRFGEDAKELIFSSSMGLNSIYFDSTSWIVTYSIYGFTLYSRIDKTLKQIEGSRTNSLVVFRDEIYTVGHDGLFKVVNDSLFLVDTIAPLNYRFDDIQVFRSGLALASKGQGIVFYKNGDIQSISKTDGLSSNFVTSLYVEDDNSLWACTNKGISRIVFDSDLDYHIEAIDYDDGLPSNDVIAMTILNDTVWVGTSEDVCYFRKDLLNNSDRRIKRFLKVDKIRVNDHLVNQSSLADLSYDDNRLEVRYSAISFNDYEKLSYRYRLKGLELEWRYTNGLNAIYSSLPPGNYTFLLQVQGPDGNWKNEEIAIPVSISPPYWKTWWFRSVIAGLIILLIYSFFRLRILTYNRDILREILRQILKRIRTRSLYIVVKESGREVRIDTSDILYVKSEGNYLAIHTEKGKHLIRDKISRFIDLVPDPLEFIQIHRSYIVRIDKVSKKGKKDLFIQNTRISVGEKYWKEIDKIKF